MLSSLFWEPERKRFFWFAIWPGLGTPKIRTVVVGMSGAGVVGPERAASWGLELSQTDPILLAHRSGSGLSNTYQHERGCNNLTNTSNLTDYQS